MGNTLSWMYAKFHGQAAYKSACGQYNIFWSDDACLYLVDAPNTKSHGGFETARDAKDALQRYEDNGRRHVSPPTHTEGCAR